MPQKVAVVFLVVKLRADSHSQALHRKQVLRLRHHDAQMIQFDEGREFSLRADARTMARWKTAGGLVRALWILPGHEPRHSPRTYRSKVRAQGRQLFST